MSDDFRTEWLAAIEKAKEWYSMDDVDEDVDLDEYDSESEARFHCSTCTMNGIVAILEVPIMKLLAENENLRHRLHRAAILREGLR